MEVMMEETSSNEIEIRRQKIEELQKMGEIPYKERMNALAQFMKQEKNLAKRLKSLGVWFFVVLWENSAFAK